jgi:hypothetical protein
MICMAWLPGLGYAVAAPPADKATSVASKPVLNSKKKVAKKKASRSWSVDMVVTGGVILPWAAPDEAGNNFAASLAIQWSFLKIGVTYSGVLPDSRAQGLFSTMSLESQFFITRPYHRFQPYALVGIGVAFPDDADQVSIGESNPLRWSTAYEFVGTLGVGVRYGRPRGLYMALDLRAYNHTHGGFNLSAGMRF